MTLLYELTVYGDPGPQGSKHGRPVYKGPKGAKVFTGKVAMVESSAVKVKTWRGDVRDVALEVRGDRAPLTGPLLAEMVFTAVRPKSHYRTGRNAHLLRDSAPARPQSKPDVSKLARSTEDALTSAGIYKDDALIVEYLRLAKVYAGEDRDALDAPGVIIRLHTLGDQT